ncbi:hypothetical protein SARC_02819 [Sphaeroforma arctica JP610]|uniref:Uncharacterized protein n=1 Tax=Sphaeroforma arctica JP610 TaxID=667725 RepID=A0A0L0G7R3_9EUKA|nr:hypothetical protein SARC_02819 [Sphaeroforma arctica JP610]KNC84964.1 hypothetical protein SARC_02819 [Sphaeroforma arctica JP610]|eukprot:XP_014158866.1 hypothetical protein SARC_02819 [Sphaeroforma arctica JP610]
MYYNVMQFLSTGGATIAVPSTPATNIRLGSNPSAFQGTATWREYNPYARRLFGRTILPVCTATYLTIALILYFATICNWACKDILTFVFTPIAASLALLVTMWTGSMAYRLRKHPVVINRGLVYVVQVHVGTLLGIPVVCVFALQHAGIFTPISAELTILNTYSSFCTFTFFSAVIARQRQIIHLFGLSSYRDAPKNKYRNTVFYIGTMYVVANIASVLFIYLWGDTDYSYLPVLLVDFLCMLMWFICAYQSRHASARFSDFDQLRRLVVMVGMGLIITIIWGYAQHEAFIVQSMVTLMLMIVFLLDSYLSLFRFIQCKWLSVRRCLFPSLYMYMYI